MYAYIMRIYYTCCTLTHAFYNGHSHAFECCYTYLHIYIYIHTHMLCIYYMVYVYCCYASIHIYTYRYIYTNI